MKDLFLEDGHLSDYAFSCLVHDEQLDELQRLEVAEHLSFCDQCVAKYADLLADDALLVSSQEQLAPGVMQRLRQRARKIFINKYSTAVVAASFAIVFWNIGVFNIDVDGNSKFLNQMTDHSYSISEKAFEVSDNISKAFHEFVNNISFERGINKDEKK